MKRIVIVVNVARLKIELEFVDVEARKISVLKEYEDELKRFKFIKKLAVVKVEMEVVIKNEEDEIVAKESLLDEIDKNYVF